MLPRAQRLGRYASYWRCLRLVGNDPGYVYVRCVCFVVVPRWHVSCVVYARTSRSCKELTFHGHHLCAFVETWAIRK